MDIIDKKILCALDLNCRSPISKLAKNLRISRNVASYRINNMVKSGIIRKFIASVNLGRLGYRTYKIYLKIWTGKPSEKDFVKYIMEKDNIVHFLKTEGEFDYSISIGVKSIAELDNFILILKNNFRDLIKDYYITILVYSKVCKLNKLLLGEKVQSLKFEKISYEEKTITLDKKDAKILHVLSQSANIPITELAKQTKLSLDVVKYRLRKITKNLITSYRIMLDINRLGYYHYVVMLRIRNATRQEEEKFVAWCMMKREVIYCSKRIGHFDFDVSIAIQNLEQLHTFLANLKAEFGPIIDNYETILNSRLLKLNYVLF